jgi:hypothetical protein
MSQVRVTRFIPVCSTCVRDEHSDTIAYLYTTNAGLVALFYTGNLARGWLRKYDSEADREAGVRDYFEKRGINLDRKQREAERRAQRRGSISGLSTGVYEMELSDGPFEGGSS